MTPEAVAEAVDAKRLVKLLRAAISIPSVTPNEQEFAKWAAQRLQEDNWDSAEVAPIAKGRSNVYARAGGTAGTMRGGAGGAGAAGRGLVLAGHLDTVHSQDWEDHWVGTDRADPYGAQVIDNEIWGRGSADQKAGICAIIEAFAAINRTGCRPKGSVLALLVCDEESGQAGSGVSAGMKAAIADGVLPGESPPEFLIYTEPTTSAIYVAQMGFLIAEITLTGKSAYFGRPELGVDALKAGHELLSKLWQHSKDLQAQEPHPLIGEAFLLVTEVHSGESIAVPGQFKLSLIRKILPRESLDEAAQAIRNIAAQVAEVHGVEHKVEFTASRDHQFGGTSDEIDSSHPGVKTLGKSITATTGEAPRIEAAPYWSEKSFLAAVGVPGVYFAPGDIACAHTPFERIDIDELVTATRTLAHFVASWCGLEPSDDNGPSSPTHALNKPAESKPPIQQQ